MREKNNERRPFGLPRAGARIRTVKAAAAALLMSMAASTAQVVHAADCQMQPMTIPVKIIESRPVATLTLNGTEVKMLVDSGAFYSFLTPSTADELKLKQRMLPFGTHISGYTGGVEARLTTVAKVGLSGVELNRIDFVVGGSELGNGIRGILGRNILAVADTEYDLAHGVVRLVLPKGDCRKASMAYWAGDAPVIEVDMDTVAGERDTGIRVPVRINGVKVSALMDTGAPASTLALGSARRAGITADQMKPFGRAAGLGDDHSARWLADIDSFQLGGEKITHQRLLVDDVDSNSHGMLLGLDYFLSHRVYVSYLQGKVYATWNGGAPFVALPGAAPSSFDQRYASAPRPVDENDADALARRASIALDAGRKEEALKDLNRAVELKPEDAHHRVLRAKVRMAMNQRDGAVADADEALRLDPAMVDALMLRATLRVSDNRPATLADVAALDRALPPSGNFRLVMGSIYAHYGMAPEALAQWAQWETAHPDDLTLAPMLNERCWLRARLGLELPLALQDCKRAIGKDGQSAIYRDSLGWVQLRMGDAQRAREAFDEALQLDARLTGARYGRGLALRKLGDAAAAQRDLDAARAAAPGIAGKLRKQGLPVPEGMD